MLLGILGSKHLKGGGYRGLFGRFLLGLWTGMPGVWTMANMHELKREAKAVNNNINTQLKSYGSQGPKA